MKTLKEYYDFLMANDYKEVETPFGFLDGHLTDVQFIKNGFKLILGVEETKEFSKYLDSFERDTEYEVKFENYIVNFAFIEAPICNVSDYLTGKTDGIQLVSEPNVFNRHTLDLFEFCLGFQKINLLEHELFIMSRRIEQLKWAKDVLIPILEKHDYHVNYDVFFYTKSENRTNSNPIIDLTHMNGEQITLEIDCLTGKSIIWHSALKKTIDLSDKIYGKNSEETYKVLLEEVWKKDEDKYGYIYNNDPHETVDTYYEFCGLLDSINLKKKNNKINFDVIPKRYDDIVKYYRKIFKL